MWGESGGLPSYFLYPSKACLLAGKLLMQVGTIFLIVEQSGMERVRQLALTATELAQLARPVDFAGDIVSECMIWVLVLFYFSEWK